MSMIRTTLICSLDMVILLTIIIVAKKCLSLTDRIDNDLILYKIKNTVLFSHYNVRSFGMVVFFD